MVREETQNEPMYLKNTFLNNSYQLYSCIMNEPVLKEVWSSVMTIVVICAMSAIVVFARKVVDVSSYK